MVKTVSAKVPDELKDEIDREGINVSEVIREALSDELRDRRRTELQRDSAALGNQLAGRVDKSDVATAVRETREEN
ncbi:ribbon-helix-helix protein, CopG family [Halococcus sediminicola]|uniref:ribbon-helix-helix protein, CopG family n=1 Tax=Halococcus sediminicola TaxID=1264579 RepID=UPI0006797E08|nr:ribbon-helix-helix protein, CopG family [Halococcus sediminicola]